MRAYLFPAYLRSRSGLYLPARRARPRTALDNLVAQSLFGDASARVGHRHDADEDRAEREADAALRGVPAHDGGAGDARARAARIHTGPESARAAAALGARAFTRGQDIHFGAGEFQPHSRDGRRLIAHELSHVRHGGDPHRVHRDEPEDGVRADAGDDLDELDVFEVRELTLAEFQAQTGIDPALLPENEYTAMDTLMHAAGYGLVCQAPSRLLDLPANTTGVLWEGSHISDWSRAGGEFSNVRGFRAPLWTHVWSDLERSRIGGPFAWLARTFGGSSATASLNRGVPGSYAADWMFPYSPRASVVYRTSPHVDAPGFANYMDDVAGSYAGRTYTYSPPPQGSSAFLEAFGEGGCAPSTHNCLNVPVEPHRRALGLGPQEPLPFVPDEAAGSRRFLGTADDYFFGDADLGPNLARKRIGPTMLAGGAIRVGGTVLLLYGAYGSARRIANAAPGRERQKVVLEEAAGWGGGAIGGWIANALGRATICGATGPGAFVCAAGVTIVGSVVGDLGGRAAVESVEEGLELMADPHRFMEASAWFSAGLGNGQSVCDYYRAEVMLAEMNGYDLDPGFVADYEDILGCRP